MCVILKKRTPLGSHCDPFANSYYDYSCVVSGFYKNSVHTKELGVIFLNIYFK